MWNVLRVLWEDELRQVLLIHPILGNLRIVILKFFQLVLSKCLVLAVFEDSQGVWLGSPLAVE